MVKRILTFLIALTLVFTSVNFTEVQASKKMKLNKTQVLVRIGSPVKLKVKNVKKKKKIKWKSSDKKIATVSKKGVVKGKNDGNCTITAKIGKKKLKCKIAVACKVAKKTTAKTMAAVAKKVKAKGTYNSSEGFYRYREKFDIYNFAYIVSLKYFPKTNHLEVETMLNDETLTITFHVGDKRKCVFEYKDSTYGYNAKGLWDTNRVKDDYLSISFTNTNVPYEYHEYAKKTLYPYLNNTMYCFDKMMKSLKTKVDSESFGFNYPLSNYFEK
jgi:hypothetical protein